MNPQQQRALLTLLVQAAMADGQKADSERQFIRELALQLDADSGAAHLTQALHDALIKRVTLEAAVAQLGGPEQRQLAYEWALAVCDADGVASTAELAFLSQLRALLGLNASAEADASERQTHALASASQGRDWLDADEPAAAAAPAPLAAPLAPAAPAAPDASDPALDKMILNYSILNGALELLPQSWASVAIIPLQIKMVYRVGKAHGVALDQGHIREFIAAAGVGLTSQYLEQFGRKLLGGLIGRAAGKTAGGLGARATGVAFSFATTYALGHLAKRYYAGGRVMSTDLVRQTFQGLLGPAKQLQQQYGPQIAERARTLDAASVMRLVRG